MKLRKNLESLNEVTHLICSDFKIEEISWDNPDFQALKKNVEKIVRNMLNTQFEVLLQIFYRIDVDENKVKQILSTHNPDDICSDLAELIIERELIKVASRRKYRG